MTGSGPTRRLVIIGAAATGGGLAVGFDLGQTRSQAHAKRAAAQPADPEITPWIIIRPDEQVIIRIARAELGQGTATGLAQLVAEELDCDWPRVVIEFPTPGQSQARDRVFRDFATSASRGVRASQEYMRQAGAAARAMLLEAASDFFKVPVGELKVDKGIVTHTPSNRSATFGRLAPLAAKLKAPDPRYVRLTEQKDWTIAGKPLKRLDTAEKLNGRAVYGIDLKLPGMLNAAIRDAPVFGAKLKSFDAAAISKRLGVRHVLKVGETAVAVVADTWWRAKTALDLLPVEWETTADAQVTSASIAEFLKEGLEVPAAFIGTTHGDALKAIAGSAKRVEAAYQLPFLHHATLEPMNATARWSPDRVEVWAPTQNAEAALQAAADAAGLPVTRAEVHRTLIGGAFGRRGRQDYVRQAVLIARQVPDTAIKLVWSREEDTTHGYYRPVSQAKLTGGIDAKGELTGLILRISGQSIVGSQTPAAKQPGKDSRMFQGLFAEAGEAQIGYSIPNLYIDHAMRNTHVPVGSWRGVHSNQNAIYLECFIDEAAKAAGRDPYEFRRGMMRSHGRHLAVLTAAAETAGWGRPLAEGIHRGMAQAMAYGSYAAAVAEVSVSPAGAAKVHRVVMALDSGHVVNPAQVSAQLEGQVAFALGAVFHQEITIRNGRVVETNFDRYPALRMAEMPAVETVLVPSGEFWGGVGEAAIAVVAPAVLNAIYAATGKRVRTLPLKNVKLV